MSVEKASVIDAISISQESGAERAVQQCRKAGYQVSAVVVDRGGAVQVVMRDDLASRFTVEIAQKKANAVVLSGVASSTFVKSRADIRAEMNHVDGILMLEGGLPMSAATAIASLPQPAGAASSFARDGEVFFIRAGRG